MSKNNKKVESGVPRPYSNKKLPTPKYILSESIKPLNVPLFLLIISLFFASLLVIISSYTSESFNPTIISLSILIASFGILISLLKQNETNNIDSVPSINNVSKTVEYVRASSRLTILTIISGIFMIGFIIISHVSDAFYFIDDSTRITIVLLISLSFVFSYIMIKTLCSYTSIYKNTSLSIPLSISSIPEFIILIGFIIPPGLVIFAGLIYNGPPIVDISFSLSLIDTIAILTSIQILYISLASRI